MALVNSKIQRLLDRDSELGRVLFTRDDDLLTEATRRQRATTPFLGVIYAHQLRVSIARCIQDLETISKVIGPRSVKIAAGLLRPRITGIHSLVA
jgi:hypothetical protein